MIITFVFADSGCSSEVLPGQWRGGGGGKWQWIRGGEREMFLILILLYSSCIFTLNYHPHFWFVQKYRLRLWIHFYIQYFCSVFHSLLPSNTVKCIKCMCPCALIDRFISFWLCLFCIAKIRGYFSRSAVHFFCYSTHAIENRREYKS